MVNVMLKCDKHKIMIFLSVLIFLKPSNVSYWSMVDSIYKLLKVLIMLVLIVKYIRSGAKIRKKDVLLFTVLLIWLFSAYCNLHSFGDNLQQVLSIIGIFLLVKIINTKDKVMMLLESIAFLTKIYVFLELITIFLDHPLFADAMGRSDRFFLGNDNYSAFVIIPLCGIMMASSLFKNNKINKSTWFFLFIAFLCFAVPGSVTAIVSFGILIVCAIFLNWSFLRKALTIKSLIAFAILFVGMVVCFNIQDYFGVLLSVIGKTALNSRETIWPKAVGLIRQKPMFGWGVLTERQIEGYVLYGASHAHNIILQLLLDIGIIGTALLGIWLYGIIKYNKCIKKKYMYILYLCMWCYLFASIFDFYFGLIYFWLMLFIYDMLGQYERNTNMR